MKSAAKKKASKKIANKKSINYKKWIEKDLWSLREALFLLNGLEPDPSSPNTEQLNETRDQINRGINAGKLKPVGEYTQADKMYDRPMFEPRQVIQWGKNKFNCNKFLKYLPKIDRKSLDEEEISKKERQTLHKIIYGLAKIGKIDISHNSKTANSIVRTLQQVGIEIGIRTIETHLNHVENTISDLNS